MEKSTGIDSQQNSFYEESTDFISKIETLSNTLNEMNLLSNTLSSEPEKINLHSKNISTPVDLDSRIRRINAETTETYTQADVISGYTKFQFDAVQSQSVELDPSIIYAQIESTEMDLQTDSDYNNTSKKQVFVISRGIRDALGNLLMEISHLNKNR